MTVLRLFNMNVNLSGRRNLLFSMNTMMDCKGKYASLSAKALEKLGIPLPPKRPLSPYLRFFQDIRPQILQNQPNLSPNEVTKVVAQEWSKYNPEKKKLLQTEYLSEMQIYLSKSEKYKQSITPEQNDLIQSTKEKIKHAKEMALIQEKKESLGKPKKPPTAFINFMLERKAEKDNDIKYSEWLKTIAKEWNNIPEDKKQKYKEESKTVLEKYKSALSAWEQNMIKQGHLDVVRHKELLDNKPLKK